MGLAVVMSRVADQGLQAWCQMCWSGSWTCLQTPALPVTSCVPLGRSHRGGRGGLTMRRSCSDLSQVPGSRELPEQGLQERAVRGYRCFVEEDSEES